MKFKSNLFLTITTIFAFILTSCGSSSNSIIATAVALTVQAQNTQPASVTDTPLAALATAIPLANTPSANTPAAALPTLTPFVTSSAASTGVTKFCIANATFISETIPDGTIESPGATFTKTWTIQNSGTCTWDSTWKFVYFSGDLMGAAVTYPLTSTQIAPNQTLNFSIVLTAPTDEATYTGYWKLESPYGCVFGDSGGGACSGVPYSVQIAVNSGTPGANTPTVYGITSVTFSYGTTNKRSIQPIPGVNAGYCTGGANIFLTTFATISVSGPLTVTYYWAPSDGGGSGSGTLNFTEASTQTIQDTWPLGAGHEIGLRWENLVVTSPIKQTFKNTTAQYDHECQ